jgi:hypothetical protein
MRKIDPVNSQVFLRQSITKNIKIKNEKPNVETQNQKHKNKK